MLWSFHLLYCFYLSALLEITNIHQSTQESATRVGALMAHHPTVHSCSRKGRRLWVAHQQHTSNKVNRPKWHEGADVVPSTRSNLFTLLPLYPSSSWTIYLFYIFFWFFHIFCFEKAKNIFPLPHLLLFSLLSFCTFDLLPFSLPEPYLFFQNLCLIVYPFAVWHFHCYKIVVFDHSRNPFEQRFRTIFEFQNLYRYSNFWIFSTIFQLFCSGIYWALCPDFFGKFFHVFQLVELVLLDSLFSTFRTL